MSRFKLAEAAAAAIAGYKTAARLVIVGTVLTCGGNKRQAKKVADLDGAMSLIDGQVRHLADFAKVQLGIIKCRIHKSED